MSEVKLTTKEKVEKKKKFNKPMDKLIKAGTI